MTQTIPNKGETIEFRGRRYNVLLVSDKNIVVENLATLTKDSIPISLYVNPVGATVISDRQGNEVIVTDFDAALKQAKEMVDLHDANKGQYPEAHLDWLHTLKELNFLKENAPYQLDSTDCECDNGHKQNDTVCMPCWNRGRRKWDDPD